MKPATRTIDFAEPDLHYSTAASACPWELTTRPLERGSHEYSRARALHVVGLLAFGQSLIFLAIWLLICASAGAAPAKKPEFSADLQLSTYEPTKKRDPFSNAAASGAVN